jgi:hypothetical protein
MQDMISVTALWWAVIVSGLYHGLNPGMGWPLAVSAALMERKQGALVKASGGARLRALPGDDGDPVAILADDGACDVGTRNPAWRGPAGDWPWVSTC